MASLADPRMLMERAAEHLKAANTELRAFYDSDPVLFSTEVNDDVGWCIIRVAVTKPPPPRIGVIVGDAAHNMRAALDHLAWQLALTQTPEPYWRTEFPITDCATGDTRRQFNRVVQSLPLAAVDIIEKLQPYNLGESAAKHPLWLLDKLCNIAKHVTIPVHSMFLEFKTPRVEGLRYIFLPGGGAWFAVPVVHKELVDRILKPRAGVGFGMQERGVDIDPEQVLGIYEFIRDDVLPRFADFFSDPK